MANAIGEPVAKSRIKRVTMPKNKALLARASNSEVEAYAFIREQLKELGWNVKDPSRHSGGQIWTQNQCLADEEIKNSLNLLRPENIIKVREEDLWIVEAKSERSFIDRALSEAENDYAAPINARGNYRVPFITGVAGNETDGYEVRTRMLVNGSYIPVVINGREATGLLDPTSAAELLRHGTAELADLAIDEVIFLRSAERINKTLHIGGINKNDRARVMAALLLAIVEEPGPSVDSDLLVLIDDINARAKAVLRKSGKAEFYPFVQIQPPSNAENHTKYRAAIVKTLQELRNLNIKSAMNSGNDVLGKFYEVFLKYGNGAKEIGIVLTPRHVTKFAVEAVGVGPTDLVYDPACGTGGFLVAAFDHVRATATPHQLESFKKHNLFGVERESYIASLAIVNMIFRGDGKTNIVEANCFKKFLKRDTVDGHLTAKFDVKAPSSKQTSITRVLMNPPFALKESDEQEYRFIDVALTNMVDGGLLAAIVPMSVFFERSTTVWRTQSLLAHNTLLSVITLPLDLFYPTGVRTVCAFIKKGHPHPRDQNVLWGRAMRDGLVKRKGKRLQPRDGGLSPSDDLGKLLPLLKAFIADQKTAVVAQPELVTATPIDFDDPLVELLPEVYLESLPLTPTAISERIESMLRETAASMIRLRS